MGAFHISYRSLGTFWAHYRPVSITSRYATEAMLETADAILIINKPTWFDTRSTLTDLWTVLKGRVYCVTRVEDVDGMTRGDVRLFVQQDAHMRPETFLGKVID